VNPQPITDQSLDALIEAARPNLREALRRGLQDLVPVSMMEAAIIPLPSGQQWKLVLAVMTEPMAALAGAVLLTGVPAMSAAFQKAQDPAPVPPTSGGLMVPGE
jgi:hypothetical protein